MIAIVSKEREQIVAVVSAELPRIKVQEHREDPFADPRHGLVTGRSLRERA
jgi:hypothetical protein